MENEEIVVSVCMLAYNHGKYIRQALDSVFMQQTNFKFEVIVGEDCSPAPDNSREILLEYKEKYGDQLVLILHEKNVGVSANGNSISRKCRGKYKAFLECDDYWLDPLKLQKQVDFLDTHPDFSACGGDCEAVDDDGNVIKSSVLGLKKDSVVTMKDFRKKGMSVVHGNSLMVRRSIFPDTNPDYMKLRSAAPTMGDTITFSLLFINGPIYLFPSLFLAHRDGGKVASSFSASNSNRYIEYTYMRMDIEKALTEYFHGEYDFSFLNVNRIADAVFLYVTHNQQIHIEKEQLKKLLKDRKDLRFKVACAFTESMFHRIGKKASRILQH